MCKPMDTSIDFNHKLGQESSSSMVDKDVINNWQVN